MAWTGETSTIINKLVYKLNPVFKFCTLASSWSFHIVGTKLCTWYLDGVLYYSQIYWYIITQIICFYIL